jgi:hypothetical protein
MVRRWTSLAAIGRGKVRVDEARIGVVVVEERRAFVAKERRDDML